MPCSEPARLVQSLFHLAATDGQAASHSQKFQNTVGDNGMVDTGDVGAVESRTPGLEDRDAEAVGPQLLLDVEQQLLLLVESVVPSAGRRAVDHLAGVPRGV